MMKPSLLLLSLVVVSGCAMTGTSTMRTTKPVSSEGAKCLVVLLPGYGDTPETFEKQGFTELLLASGASVDVIAADATMWHHRSGTFVDRLRFDVIEPAREAHPYEQLWIMGVSMGGFGSLFYSAVREGDVEGVLAIAPYLGDAEQVEAVKAAGGLRAWDAPEAAFPDAQNYQAQLWRWMQETTAKPDNTYPAIYLGYGKLDRLAEANALLADELPAKRVYVAEGGHRWIVWRGILERFLAESSFTKTCAAD